MRYHRVIPRDLFNEANLLKCCGQLYLMLESFGPDHVSLCHLNMDRDFGVTQDEGSGAISIDNVILVARGQSFQLFRPLNSRDPWPLFVKGKDDDVSVFTDAGELSPEFLAFVETL